MPACGARARSGRYGAKRRRKWRRCAPERMLRFATPIKATRAASELEASRRLLARQSQDLRQKLDALQAAEQAGVKQVASMPTQELWKRLESQLGPGAVGKIESLNHRAIEPLK